jgi:hypothetical protein
MQLTTNELVAHLQKSCDPNEELIVTVWKQADYPDRWHAIIEAWSHREDDDLVEITRAYLDEDAAP